MPDRPAAVTANSAVLAADEQLPTFDGSQIALANWLRELQRFEHLLPSELAYWLVTGSANTAAGKTAVLSVHHAYLLYNDVVEQHGFNVVNPPPVEDKFLALYTDTRAADIAISEDDDSDLPEKPTMHASTVGAQFQVAPVRLMQLDLQYRNILLGLITSPGRKAHYAKVAGNSGAKLMRQLLMDKDSSLSAFIQDPHYAHLKAKLRQVLGMKLSCLSQEEFNNIRDQIQEINVQLPERERMTDVQQCDHYRSLITDLNSVGLTIRLDNDLMISQVPYGDLTLTLNAITRTLTRAMFEEQQRAAEAGSALQGKARPNKQPDARKRVRVPCNICGKLNHDEKTCYQNVNADEATLKRAPMSSPAGQEWARRHPEQSKPAPPKSQPAKETPHPTHSLACAEDMDALILSAFDEGSGATIDLASGASYAALARSARPVPPASNAGAVPSPRVPTLPKLPRAPRPTTPRSAGTHDRQRHARPAVPRSCRPSASAAPVTMDTADPLPSARRPSPQSLNCIEELPLRAAPVVRRASTTQESSAALAPSTITCSSAADVPSANGALPPRRRGLTRSPLLALFVAIFALLAMALAAPLAHTHVELLHDMVAPLLGPPSRHALALPGVPASLSRLTFPPLSSLMAVLTLALVTAATLSLASPALSAVSAVMWQRGVSPPPCNRRPLRHRNSRTPRKRRRLPLQRGAHDGRLPEPAPHPLPRALRGSPYPCPPHASACFPRVQGLQHCRGPRTRPYPTCPARTAALQRACLALAWAIPTPIPAPACIPILLAAHVLRLLPPRVHAPASCSSTSPPEAAARASRALLGRGSRPAKPEAPDLPCSPSSKFVVDSGASFHMHPHRGDLINVRPCADSIVGVDRRSHACPYVGDLPLLAIDAGGRYVKVVLRNVRHAPTLHDTLISVERLWRDDGISARFQDECTLKLPSGRSLDMARSQGLFLWEVRTATNLRATTRPLPMPRDPAQPRDSALNSFAVHSSKTSSHIAALKPDIAAAHIHRRLHVGVKRMASLPALTADAPPNIAKARLNACPHCVTANATRHPHKATRYVESTPGRLVHADIAGPFLKSAKGHYQYLLVLVDDHTRFKFAFPLVRREDAPKRIREFVASFNRLASTSNGTISSFGTLHTDGAGEFTSGKFRDELAEAGVAKTESPPEVHALNGVAERAIKSIFAHVRADLDASGAPRSFWPQAVSHAVDILNRTTTPPHGRATCYESLTGDRPRIMSLLPWGCRAWAVRPSTDRRKTTIDNTAAMGVHMGRSTSQPGAYDVWLPHELKFVSSSEVYFDETFMPFRPPGDQRISDPVPELVDGDATQPPTLVGSPTASAEPSPAPLNHLAAEYDRATRRDQPLGPRLGSARLSRRVLLLFSGPYSRPDGIAAFLQRLGLDVDLVDSCPSTGGGARDDILKGDVYADLLRKAQRGTYVAVFAAPPCSTFSISRFVPSPDSSDGGPPPVRYRSKGQVMGRLDCPAAHRRELDSANELVRRMCAVLRAAFDSGSEIAIENPSDRGDPSRSELFAHHEHAPLWLMPDVINLSRHAMCRSVHFPQCAFGAPYQKWTTFLYSPGFSPGFDDLGSLRCTHTDREHAARAGGRKLDGAWISKAAAAYPPDLNHAIAHAINLLVDRLAYIPRIQARTVPSTVGHHAPAAQTALPPREPTPSLPLPVPEPPPMPAPPPPASVPPPTTRPDLPSSRTRSALRNERGDRTPPLGAAMLADALDADASCPSFVLLASPSPAHASTAAPPPPPPDPRNHLEAMRDDAEGWGAAERLELDAHRDNGSFELLDRAEFEKVAPGRRLIKLVWVYKRKRNGRLKARLCVQGCQQRAGVDFDQTHCSTLRGPSLRMLSALAGQHHLGMRRWDFVSAYLQGDLEEGEAVYCQAPPGPHGQLGADGRPRIWKTCKPVYGMAQAGRRWQRSLFPWLREWGLRQCTSDECVFHLTREVNTPNGVRTDTLILGCYVDDLFILYNSDDEHSLYNRFVADLQRRWDVDDEGEVTDLLNIEISREGTGVVLRQRAYIEKLAAAWFPDGPPAHVPVNATPHSDALPSLVLDAVSSTDPVDPHLLRRYQSLVGSLLYASTNTRPDVAYAVGMLCRAMARPSTELLDAALRVLAYLHQHRRIGLRYECSDAPLAGMADADWSVRHSTSGYVFTLSRAAISWGSKRQPTIALSSCEAEIMAASEAAKEAVYLDRLLSELDMKPSPDPIHLSLDNKAAIDSSYNPENHSRTKHIDRRHYFIRELVESNRIVVPYVPSDANLADFFTKPLRPSKFFPLRDKIMNVRPPQS